jgi:hypothetical protein
MGEALRQDDAQAVEDGRALAAVPRARDDAEPRLARRQAPQRRGAAVCAAVVDDKDGGPMPERRGDRVEDPWAGVVARNEDETDGPLLRLAQRRSMPSSRR